MYMYLYPQRAYKAIIFTIWPILEARECFILAL